MNENPVQFSFTVKIPFTVELSGDATGTVLKCLEKVRVLPGTRLVCAAELAGEPVYAKFFNGNNKGINQWSEELQAYSFSRKHNLAVPEVIYEGGIQSDAAIKVIITRSITNSVNLSDYFSNSVRQDNFPVLEKLTRAYAALHDAGVKHSDPHLGNFLLQGDQIYMMDVASFNYSHKPLTLAQALDNFSYLLAQFPCLRTDLRDQLLTTYVEFRNITLDDKDRNKLAGLVSRHKKHRAKKFLKKIWRSSTRYTVSHSFFWHTIVSRELQSEDMEEFLHDPDRYMSSADSHMLKDGNSSTVKRIVVNGQKFIVKRYNIKNVLHLLRRLIQPTRAAISWTNANYLMHIGIKTAAPVALIEQRWGPFRGKAYFVMRELGGIDAREYFAQAQDINENLAERINNMVELLYCMHHNRISHGDMKATNFIISDSTVQVIDLDAMKIHNKNTLFRKSWKRDMRRFSRNWHQHPDLARLFREQLDKEGLTANE